MKCKVCGSKSNNIFTGKVLAKYDVIYYLCPNCNFLQTEEPYWLEEAYESTINVSDTGYMQRNILLSQRLTSLLSLFFDKNGSYVDYAGGYGVIVRLMRDIGYNFFWDDKYTSNLFAKGFEYNSKKNIEAVTTFESFEHFVNPMEEIEKILNISKNIIFSTNLLPKPIPEPENWWYYGLDHGQHVSFYSKRTFHFIAQKFNLNYVNLGSFHLLTEKNITNLQLKILKLNKIGLYKLLQKRLKSKTREDYFKMSEMK